MVLGLFSPASQYLLANLELNCMFLHLDRPGPRLCYPHYFTISLLVLIILKFAMP